MTSAITHKRKYPLSKDLLSTSQDSDAFLLETTRGFILSTLYPNGGLSWRVRPRADTSVSSIGKKNLYIYLTNRFHVVVRLFSNRSQMTSKCGKNKKVAHEAIAECVTDVLTTF